MVLITCVRLGVAAVAPLSPDEAYYWVWSRALAPGYLDHPPMVALWAWAGTWFVGETALGVRLLAPLSAAVGSVMLADAGRLMFPGSGVRAATLLNATLMLGAGAVTMTPDTPLLLFWTAGCWAMARLVAGGRGAWWLLAGGSAGLAFDSKYTAALFAGGVAIWLLTPAARPWLRTPWPWLGATVGVAATAPVVFWNAAHHWVSFIKQGGRVGDWTPSVRYVGELIAGQAGLATPGVLVLFILGVAMALRRWRSPACALVVALVVPGLLVFLQHALGGRVQANWMAVLYPGCALAAGAVPPVRWWRWAAGTGFALTAIVYGQATLALVPLGRGLDPTLRLAGWTDLATRLGDMARRDGAAFLASEEYGAASSLAWAAPGVPVLGAETRWQSFELVPAAATGAGLLLVSQRRREEPDPAFWTSAELQGVVSRSRGSMEAESYRLYRVMPRPGSGAVLLPQRRR